MIVLIDTNVVLDLLIQRAPFYEDAAKINILSEKGYIRSYMSASAVTDIYYIARKEIGNEEAVTALLENLLKTISVASVTEVSIHEALELKWEDFEDAVQYVVGQGVSAEYIVTRNPDDFKSSQIPVISPKNFLRKLGLE